jgi:DNA polymerase-3 subunit alpha
VDLKLINNEFVAKIADLVKAYPGSCNLVLRVTDDEDRVDVSMLSRPFKIAPVNELLKELDAMDGVGYRLN